MSINAKQLRELVIRPTLKFIGHYSQAAEELLMGTAAVESNLGEYLHQIGGGPALGIFQMEPATHDDIWKHYLQYAASLSGAVTMLTPKREAKQLIGNLYYAAAMARVHYLRDPHLLPPADDVEAQARYWKRVYNTRLGRGTEAHYIEAYNRLVREK